MTKGLGTGGSAPEQKLRQKGMQTRSAPASDASTRVKAGSVNADTTRKAVASNPRTLGPREA